MLTSSAEFRFTMRPVKKKTEKCWDAPAFMSDADQISHALAIKSFEYLLELCLH